MGVVRQLPNYELTTTRTCSDNFQVFFFLPAFQPLRYEVHPFFFFYRKPLLTSTTRDQIIHVLHKITSKFLIVAFFCYRSELSEVFLTYSNSFQLLLHLCQFLRQDFHFFLQLFGFFHSHPFLISTLLFSRLSQLQQVFDSTTPNRLVLCSTSISEEYPYYGTTPSRLVLCSTLFQGITPGRGVLCSTSFSEEYLYYGTTPGRRVRRIRRKD